MVGPTLKFIIWLIFSKYRFQKIVSYFPNLKQDFENGLEGVFTYLSKLFYLLNLGVYLYHKKNSHTSNLKLIIKKKKMMSSIPLSLSPKKKKKR